MSSGKLKQDKIYENIDAVRAFLHDCDSVFDNGSTSFPKHLVLIGLRRAILTSPYLK